MEMLYIVNEANWSPKYFDNGENQYITGIIEAVKCVKHKIYIEAKEDATCSIWWDCGFNSEASGHIDISRYQ